MCFRCNFIGCCCLRVLVLTLVVVDVCAFYYHISGRCFLCVLGLSFVVMVVCALLFCILVVVVVCSF